MIRARTFIGFLACVLLLVALSSNSWKRVQIQVQIGPYAAKATGGYGLRHVRGCAIINGKRKHCVNESLAVSVAHTEQLQKLDTTTLQLTHQLLRGSKKRKPRARRRPLGAPVAGQTATPTASATAHSKTQLPDLEAALMQSHTLGKRSLDRLRRARRYGAATWYLGMLLVLVLFASGVLSVMRLSYVPRYARVLVMGAPVVLSMVLVTLAGTFLMVVGESESVFAGLPALSFLGPIKVTSHNGWSVYVFGLGLVCGSVSGLMAYRWEGVSEPPREEAQPGTRSRLGQHRPTAPLTVAQVSGLLMDSGDEVNEQLDALGAYSELVERHPERVLSAYAERRAIDLARSLGEPRVEVMACERFVEAHPGHPDTPTLARAGAKVSADILGDAERAERLRKGSG